MLETLQQDLRKFIIDNFLFGQGGDSLHNDDSFLEKGIIDSTGMLELVYFLEEKYDLKLEDSELIPENLDSINKLCIFIQKKLS
jgi:acyl carrier protein